MKNLFALLFVLMLPYMGISQSCLPEGIIFSNQAQIDNFQINYPGCTEIEGSLSIYSYSGSDITNLDGLSVLTSIGGNLELGNEEHGNNPVLYNITGLEGVTNIGGNLIIYDNDALITLEGLDNLMLIGGRLLIYKNDSLTSLTGLGNLTTIGSDLIIEFSDALSTLTGLEDLTSVGESTYIYHNDALISLSGLSNLTSIGESLQIENCNSLTTLTGLDALTSIGGSLTIYMNEGLTSLTGLDNIDPASINFLSINGNDNLSYCQVKSVCDYLANPGGIIDIWYNATGCNNQEEINAACGVGLEEKDKLVSNIILYPNPASTIITIETTELIDKSWLTILNLNGQALYHYQIKDTRTMIDISHLAEGVYFVKYTGENEVRMFKVVKY